MNGDGGLFVPKHFPHLSLGDLKAMEKKPYIERSVGILMHFLTDFSEDELRAAVFVIYQFITADMQAFIYFQF